jgi:hypothetical protein
MKDGRYVMAFKMVVLMRTAYKISRRMTKIANMRKTSGTLALCGL